MPLFLYIFTGFQAESLLRFTRRFAFLSLAFLCFVWLNMLTTKAKEDTEMTRFEKDMQEALTGNATMVLKSRKAEIERLTKEGKACKNSFRRQCLAQEVARLTREYDAIDETI